jgi:hypothetical protein
LAALIAPHRPCLLVTRFAQKCPGSHAAPSVALPALLLNRRSLESSEASTLFFVFVGSQPADSTFLGRAADWMPDNADDGCHESRGNAPSHAQLAPDAKLHVRPRDHAPRAKCLATRLPRLPFDFPANTISPGLTQPHFRLEASFQRRPVGQTRRARGAKTAWLLRVKPGNNQHVVGLHPASLALLLRPVSAACCLLSAVSRRLPAPVLCHCVLGRQELLKDRRTEASRGPP